MPPPNKGPQPVRYAIQKARGKGWKTLEVGEELPHAEARFDMMVEVNPRAYFRLVQLDYNDQSDYEGMEFNWKLIHLYDPTQGVRRNAGSGGQASGGRAAAGKLAGGKSRRRAGGGGGGAAGEKLRLPIRFYLGVVLVGGLLGVLLYLRYGLGGP